MKIGLEQFNARLAQRLDPSSASPAQLAEAAQDVARELVTPEQEREFAHSILDVYTSRLVPTDPQTAAIWEKVQGVTGSAFPAPQVVNSPLVAAQADSRNLLLGKATLEGELADPALRTFAIAHEEGHRQHRDSAGTLGLEALLEGSPQGFLAMREGRHQNELEADEFSGRVVGRLGCDPKPILQYLLSLPEDVEHPAGLTRAFTVKEAMAAEGQPIAPREWARLALPGSTDDPSTWAPLYADKSALTPARLEYMRGATPGSLVLLDHFSQGGTHGAQVRDTARGEGFAGPVLEVDCTFSLDNLTHARLDAISAAEARLLASESGEEAREALRDLTVLKRCYTLERHAEELEQLTQSGARNVAVNLSHGSNAAGDAQRLLEKTVATGDPQVAAKWLIPLLRAFPGDVQAFIRGEPAERARLAGEVCQFLQDTVQDTRWQASKARYDGAVASFEGQCNSVVVAAGNEGEVGAFLEAWSLGAPVALPPGFEVNDLGNPLVTLVGAPGAYCSHNPEIDVVVDGRAVGADEFGTSFAAPRIAQRLARIHGEHSDWTSEQVEKAAL